MQQGECGEEDEVGDEQDRTRLPASHVSGDGAELQRILSRLGARMSTLASLQRHSPRHGTMVCGVPDKCVVENGDFCELLLPKVYF
jgi:hypothetical protein